MLGQQVWSRLTTPAASTQADKRLEEARKQRWAVLLCSTAHSLGTLVSRFLCVIRGRFPLALGGRWFARDLKLYFRSWGSEPQAHASLMPPNLVQEIPVPKALKYEFPAFAARL
jgi:hypothetical protein